MNASAHTVRSLRVAPRSLVLWEVTLIGHAALTAVRHALADLGLEHAVVAVDEAEFETQPVVIARLRVDGHADALAAAEQWLAARGVGLQWLPLSAAVPAAQAS